MAKSGWTTYAEWYLNNQVKQIFVFEITKSRARAASAATKVTDKARQIWMHILRPCDTRLLPIPIVIENLNRLEPCVMRHGTAGGNRDCFTEHARDVRALIRGAPVASLATLDQMGGWPFASLIPVATLPDARPCFLISDLAQHTMNLKADGRASLLVDQRCSGSALTDARVTLLGTATPLDGNFEQIAKQRFMAVHPEAESYAALPGFSCWCLVIENAHLVAGFGRIRRVAGAAIELRLDGFGDMSADCHGAELECLSHLQIEFATELHARSAVLACLDCEGLDLMVAGQRLRLAFKQPIFNRSAAIAAARVALQHWRR